MSEADGEYKRTTTGECSLPHSIQHIHKRSANPRWNEEFHIRRRPVHQAPNDTAYKRWSCHSGLKLLWKLCQTFPPPTMGARFTVFWAYRTCGPAGWLALLLTKAGDVETNPCPTTLNIKLISAINKYMSESRYP